jgi:hypothetical protein
MSTLRIWTELAIVGWWLPTMTTARHRPDVWWSSQVQKGVRHAGTDQEFEIHPDVKIDEVEVGPGPFGLRMISNVTGGQILGNRLNGTIVGPGGDWVLVGPDGFARIGVRLTFRTVDRALIYVQFSGRGTADPSDHEHRWWQHANELR